VSGGFHEILDTVAPSLAVDVWRANRLTTSGGILTGTVDGEAMAAAARAPTTAKLFFIEEASRNGWTR
jgi:phosphoserine phosphatase